LRKKWEYNVAVHQLLIDFKKAYDSFRGGILYNILIEFGIIKMCLNETCWSVWLGEHFSDMFPIKNGMKQRLRYTELKFCLLFCKGVKLGYLR